MIVADSDVLIDALRGSEPAASTVRRQLASGAFATTAITVFELLTGARSETVVHQVERLLAPMTVIPVDGPAARAAADVRRALEAAGTPIGMADYLIAGVCISRRAALLTRNRAHLERVPGLAFAEP